MKIGIIGVGRLGLCFALNLSNAGFSVVGHDIQQEYVDALSSKKFISTEPLVAEMLLTSSAQFTSDMDEVRRSDILFVFVNTPSNSDGSFSHNQVDSVLVGLRGYAGTITICSTVMPGYCDSLNDPRIVYSPQFIAQGSIIKDQLHPDLVLIGAEDFARAAEVESVYARVCKNYPAFKTMDRLSAEITKLALNCYITTKISFANNLGDICKTVGANCEAVLSAMSSDSRIGSKYFNYGYGYGGPCFPRDNKAFIHFARDYVRPHLSEATELVNEDHLLQQLKLIEKGILPSNVQIVGKSAIVTGVCFKLQSNILDESQQLRLAIALTKTHDVTIRDSETVIDAVQAKYLNLFSYEII